MVTSAARIWPGVKSSSFSSAPVELARLGFVLSLLVGAEQPALDLPTATAARGTRPLRADAETFAGVLHNTRGWERPRSRQRGQEAGEGDAVAELQPLAAPRIPTGSLGSVAPFPLLEANPDSHLTRCLLGRGCKRQPPRCWSSLLENPTRYRPRKPWPLKEADRLLPGPNIHICSARTRGEEEESAFPTQLRQLWCQVSSQLKASSPRPSWLTVQEGIILPGQ